VINVGVRKYHGINAGGIKEKIPVPSAGLLAFTLIQAAIEEETLAVHADQMLRTGYCLGCAVKTDLHQVTSSRSWIEPPPLNGAPWLAWLRDRDLPGNLSVNGKGLPGSRGVTNGQVTHQTGRKTKVPVLFQLPEAFSLPRGIKSRAPAPWGLGI
jgi:hypothetical protein